MFFLETNRELKHENVFKEKLKRIMLFFKSTVIHSGLFFSLAFLFPISLQTVLVKRKAKHCDIHYVPSLTHQCWQISPCLNIRNCSLVCAQMGHCCILGQRGGGVRN